MPANRYIRMNITREGPTPFSTSIVLVKRAKKRLGKDPSTKISARNILKGTITEIVKGATTSHVRIDIGGGVIVTASITNEAVADLKLEKGKQAYAVVKASDVMVGID
ncbi:transporter [Mesorhizobium sp. LNHC232B00]|nr:transporter [Mesorhizobium sp. LNHC232B00]